MGSDLGTVILCSPNPGRIADYPTIHADSIYALGASPDGKIAVSGDKDGNMVIWNTETRTGREIPSAHRSAIRSIAFSADGSFFVTGGKDRMVFKWDTMTGQKLEQFIKGHKSLRLRCNDQPGRKPYSIGWVGQSADSMGRGVGTSA